MRTYIFLDTNNWIYLSNGFNVYSNEHDELHLKIFSIIKNRVSEGSLTFLINDIVIDEWRRNKAATEAHLNELAKRFKLIKESLREIKNFLQSDLPEITSLRTKLHDEYSEKIERYKNHILEVEDFLFHKTVKIDITDNNKIQSADLALAKKAPFIGDKKNSMADALILLSSIEYLETKHKFSISDFGESDFLLFPDSYFVSSNKGDFSSENNKEEIHPDLESILKKTNTKFFFALSRLVRELEENFLTEAEEALIEHADERSHCEECDFEYEATVEYSQYFKIFDPYKFEYDPRQLKIEFGDTENNPSIDENLNEEYENSLSNIRTAECSRCGAEYIECLCGGLVHIESYNSKLECSDCGNKYKVHADIDKKGMVHSLEYELVKDYECKTCGKIVELVDDSGNCEHCAEYEKSYIEE